MTIKEKIMDGLSAAQKKAVGMIQGEKGGAWFRWHDLNYARAARATCKHLHKRGALERRYIKKIRDAEGERRIELLSRIDAPFEYRLVLALRRRK